MVIIVHHSKLAKIYGEEWPADYERVARIEIEEKEVEKALEKAFQLTNHIDRPWWDTVGMEVIQKSRSSSVGDIFEVQNHGESGFYRVGNLCWEKI